MNKDGSKVALHSDVKSVTKIISVDDSCMESYPCQHYLKLEYKDGHEESTSLFGTQIALLYKHLGMAIPQHFQEYEDLIE
jgi:hypothetical protein